MFWIQEDCNLCGLTISKLFGCREWQRARSRSTLTLHQLMKNSDSLKPDPYFLPTDLTLTSQKKSDWQTQNEGSNSFVTAGNQLLLVMELLASIQMKVMVWYFMVSMKSLWLLCLLLCLEVAQYLFAYLHNFCGVCLQSHSLQYYSQFAMFIRIGLIQLSHVIALLMTNIEITIVGLPLLYIFLHVGITLYPNILRTTFNLTKLPKIYAPWRQSLEASNCIQSSPTRDLE